MDETSGWGVSSVPRNHFSLETLRLKLSLITFSGTDHSPEPASEHGRDVTLAIRATKYQHQTAPTPGQQTFQKRQCGLCLPLSFSPSLPPSLPPSLSDHSPEPASEHGRRGGARRTPEPRIGNWSRYPRYVRGRRTGVRGCVFPGYPGVM